MKLRPPVVFAFLALAAAAFEAGCSAPVAAQSGGPRASVTGAMPSFRDEAELRAWLKKHGPQRQRYESLAMSPPADAAAAAAEAPAAAARADGEESITNNQVAGVDEGGIVKVSGQHLVILRRGRLFTVSTAGGDLRPVDSINAFPPGVDARADWYDEMLVSRNMVVVIGYSYGRGGTEINRFRITPDGRLSFLDSHHLRSNDYYSDRNYASRLVGDQLVVYSPLYLYGDDPMEALPAVARWREGETRANFKPIAGPRQVYVPAPMKGDGEHRVEAMHSVSRCDLTAVEMTCDATVVLGQAGRTFYVSRDAVYVWVGPQWRGRRAHAFLYRMPLDGAPPSAVGVHGQPIDQFSFNARPDRLQVLVASSGGDAMWAPHGGGGSPALLSLPLSRFGDGSDSAGERDYRALPGDEETGIPHDRWVGEHLFYGQRRWDGRQVVERLVVVDGRGGEPTVFDMPDGVDRIEQLGRDGLVVGSRGATTFQTVLLDPGRAPRLGSRYAQPGAREAESRSHGFFYRADASSPDSGLLGLPVLKGSGGAELLFLRRAERALSDFGGLEARAEGRREDGCVVSCVDWYGNARPIFLRGRVFALMGYELVEGDASGGRIREVRRVDFSPRVRMAASE